MPLGAAFPGWGEALVWLGFISAFYGVAIGVTQRDPKTMLAYSSISQMGVIAAALGMALASADQGAATNVAFYAANHVLVKAALFLTVGAVAALDGRARTLALHRGGVARLQPCRIAADRRRAGQARGQGPVRRRRRGRRGAAVRGRHHRAHAHVRHAPRALARSGSSRGARLGRLWSWAALAVAALLVPWLMFAAVGSPAEALDPAKLWDAIWPMLVGAALARGLWAVDDRLPRIPAGDIVVAEEAAFHGLVPLGAAFERADRGLREWPAAGLALLMVALALAAAGWASR